MAFKDRVKELRRVPASEIKPHPQNPRLHSDDQRRTLRYMLKKVGVADVSVVYDDPEWGLTLIDGHMRQGELDSQELVPAVVLDVTREEAKLLLLSMDQIGSLATLDQDKVSSLFGDTYDPAGEHLNTLTTLFGSISAAKDNPFDDDEDDPVTRMEKAAGEKKPDATLDLYPLAAELNEKHDFVTIVCQTDREFAALCEKLGVTRERCYKSTQIGTGRVKLFRDVKGILGIDA